MSEVNRLEDTSLVAYLQMKGFVVIPWISRESTLEEPTARISFDVEGDITDAVESYYANEMVRIGDYVKNLKAVRGMMYNLKSINRNQKEKM